MENILNMSVETAEDIIKLNEIYETALHDAIKGASEEVLSELAGDEYNRCSGLASMYMRERAPELWKAIERAFYLAFKKTGGTCPGAHHAIREMKIPLFYELYPLFASPKEEKEPKGVQGHE